MRLAAEDLNGWAKQVPLWLVYAAGFVPAVAYFMLGFADRLGADPLKVLERELGQWALRFLIASLAVTPLRQTAGVNLLRFRRAIGLLAFYYAALHLTTYLVLDQGLDWAAIGADILKRPYITVGITSFCLLVPLALTSNNAAIRSLGAQAWGRLHRLVYPAAAGAAVHYLLSVKAWPREPLVYAALVAGLLGYRLIAKVARPTRVRAARR